MFCVYILQSQKDRKLYIGFTSDLKSRFEKHNNGKVNSTKHRQPLKLIYYEAYQNKDVALKREKLLKHSGKAYAALKKRLELT